MAISVDTDKMIEFSNQLEPLKNELQVSYYHIYGNNISNIIYPSDFDETCSDDRLIIEQQIDSIEYEYKFIKGYIKKLIDRANAFNNAEKDNEDIPDDFSDVDPDPIDTDPEPTPEPDPVDLEDNTNPTPTPSDEDTTSSGSKTADATDVTINTTINITTNIITNIITNINVDISDLVTLIDQVITNSDDLEHLFDKASLDCNDKLKRVNLNYTNLEKQFNDANIEDKELLSLMERFKSATYNYEDVLSDVSDQYKILENKVNDIKTDFRDKLENLDINDENYQEKLTEIMNNYSVEMHDIELQQQALQDRLKVAESEYNQELKYINAELKKLEVESSMQISEDENNDVSEDVDLDSTVGTEEKDNSSSDTTTFEDANDNINDTSGIETSMAGNTENEVADEVDINGTVNVEENNVNNSDTNVADDVDIDDATNTETSNISYFNEKVADDMEVNSTVNTDTSNINNAETGTASSVEINDNVVNSENAESNTYSAVSTENITIDSDKLTEILENEDIDESLRTSIEGIENISLTADEELELAKKASTGDEDAINELASASLKIVVNVAIDYSGQGVSFQDLVDEGNSALMSAINNFDSEQEFNFCQFATTTIEKAVMQKVSFSF